MYVTSVYINPYFVSVWLFSPRDHDMKTADGCRVILPAKRYRKTTPGTLKSLVFPVQRLVPVVRQTWLPVQRI